jgi:hypothetical protein
LNLTAKKSEENREISTELVQENYSALMKDIKILRKHSDDLSKTLALKIQNQKLTLLKLENREFFWHPVLNEDFSRSKYLEKILAKVCEVKPQSYEELLAIEGVGPKTIRALTLVAEVIYGADPSYEDPARYSFAHGGKDATPYPVDRPTYDKTIKILSKKYPYKRTKVEENKIN